MNKIYKINNEINIWKDLLIKRLLIVSNNVLMHERESVFQVITGNNLRQSCAIKIVSITIKIVRNLI